MKLKTIIAMALYLSPACMCLAQEVPKPVDRNYPGVIELHVDATNVADFYYSIGFNLDSNGRIVEVLWNSPAFKAGLSQGFTVIAINGKAYKPELLKSAISAAKVEHQAIELLLRQADRYQTTRIEYYEGLKYPRLERIEGTPDRLEAIFRPLP